MLVNLTIYRCPGCNHLFAVGDDVPVHSLVCPRLRCNCSDDAAAIDHVEIHMVDEEGTDNE